MNKKEDSKRDRHCSFEIDVLIKKLTKDTKKNDQFLKRPVPLQGKIVLRNHHSHSTSNFEALKYLRISDETRQQFLEYFNNGLGPAAAMSTHEAKLLLDDPSGKILSDAAVNPNSRTVYFLHTKWLESSYGRAWAQSTPINKLKEKLQGYKEEGTIHTGCFTRVIKFC